MGADVTIVGGGLGGLSAAVAAAGAGRRVELLEAKADLGGRARTAVGPYRANWGPHVVYSDGAFWRWLDDRHLTGGVHGAPRVPRIMLRLDGRARRRPPAGLVRALLRIRRTVAEVDQCFDVWASGLGGEDHAARIAAFMGVATFDRDPGRLSAAFVHERLRRATAFPPTVRYFPGGWTTIVERLAARARALGARIETNSRVDALPDGPTILAVPMRAAAKLLGATPSGAVTTTTTALLDLGLRRHRRDPYVLSDLDAAVERLEALVDVAYPAWRERETWRRRARVEGETGALDLPGLTWRDRPSVRQGDDVWLVNDFVAAPGLLAEVSHRAALAAVRSSVSHAGPVRPGTWPAPRDPGGRGPPRPARRPVGDGGAGARRDPGDRARLWCDRARERRRRTPGSTDRHPAADLDAARAAGAQRLGQAHREPQGGAGGSVPAPSR